MSKTTQKIQTKSTKKSTQKGKSNSSPLLLDTSETSCNSQQPTKTVEKQLSTSGLTEYSLDSENHKKNIKNLAALLEQEEMLDKQSEEIILCDSGKRLFVLDHNDKEIPFRKRKQLSYKLVELYSALGDEKYQGEIDGEPYLELEAELREEYLKKKDHYDVLFSTINKNIKMLTEYQTTCDEEGWKEKVWEVERNIAELNKDLKKLKREYKALTIDKIPEIEHQILSGDWWKGQAQKVDDCSNYLHFAKDKRDPLHKKVIGASRCHDKLCPMCASQAANKVFRNWLRVAEEICINIRPGSYFNCATLSPPVCRTGELREHIKMIKEAWYKLRRVYGKYKKAFTDCMYAMEITVKANERGEVFYHPHFHILFLVDEDYHKKDKNGNKPNYIETRELVEQFTRCCELVGMEVPKSILKDKDGEIVKDEQGDPVYKSQVICHMKAVYAKTKTGKKVKGKKGLPSGVREACKYLSKPSDYLTNKYPLEIKTEIIQELVTGTKDFRFNEMTGLCKKVKAELGLVDDVEDDWKLDPNDENIKVETFFWKHCNTGITFDYDYIYSKVQTAAEFTAEQDDKYNTLRINRVNGNHWLSMQDLTLSNDREMFVEFLHDAANHKYKQFINYKQNSYDYEQEILDPTRDKFLMMAQNYGFLKMFYRKYDILTNDEKEVVDMYKDDFNKYRALLDLQNKTKSENSENNLTEEEVMKWKDEQEANIYFLEDLFEIQTPFASSNDIDIPINTDPDAPF